MLCSPAEVVCGGAAIGDTLTASSPTSLPPNALPTPIAGTVAPLVPALVGSGIGAKELPADAGVDRHVGNPSSPAGGSGHNFTDEELQEILGDPKVDALMVTQRASASEGDGRPDGGHAGDAPPVVVGDGEEDYWAGSDADVPGGRNIDADRGVANPQPGVGAPPPPPIVESTQAPALVKPSEKVIWQLTHMLAVRGRMAQFVRDAFKGMVAAVTTELKCGIKNVQSCLIPWWPYVLSEDPDEVVLPGTIWPMKVLVPKRLALANKRSRDEDADGDETIVLPALPASSGHIDDLVASIILLHDNKKVTQAALANHVFLVRKKAHLTAAEASAAVASRLVAAKEKQKAAAGGGNSTQASRIAPAAVAPRVASLNLFSVAAPRPAESPLRALGNPAAAASANGRKRGTPRRAPSVARMPASAARRAALSAAAHAAASATARPAVASGPEGSVGGASATKRRRSGVEGVSRAVSSVSDVAGKNVGAVTGPGGRKVCTTSGPCLLVGPAGDTIARADAFFERRKLHGHAVSANMVVVFVDVVVSGEFVYQHERAFPKERPASQDTWQMWEVHDDFVVWEKTWVVETDVMSD
ncbi:hypothetical protein BU14_0303s0021 [Porphyra umbilicalis]|uniref:Uncharacterized protein n=1 Tax=Porphyra umbilicalis TaxID=2786 RepID=A0A1X6P098_PORUM|nr:hypothetical protein BU14_0303s0021 [Porphyra umbilicalis]|eukprot:OSX74190.1 hypothetical protein BU14_0303s0021 [Porphyra umbilicalis]